MSENKKTELSLTALKRAASTLRLALSTEPKNDLERDGAIQRFEYSFELAWKTLKRYLELYSSITGYNIKDVFREAARLGIIDSVEAWFDYLEARNLTSHTYDEPIAQQTYNTIKNFEKDLVRMIAQLEKRIA